MQPHARIALEAGDLSQVTEVSGNALSIGLPAAKPSIAIPDAFNSIGLDHREVNFPGRDTTFFECGALLASNVPVTVNGELRPKHRLIACIEEMVPAVACALRRVIRVATFRNPYDRS